MRHPGTAWSPGRWSGSRGGDGNLKDGGKTTGEIKLFPLASLKKAEPK